MQRVAVDAKAGGGLDLDAVASLEHLLDQLALNLADDAVVKVVGAGPRAADALADELDGQAAEVAAAAAMADRPGRGFSAQLGRQVFDEELGTRSQDHRPLDIILELANVSRPVVFPKPTHGLEVDLAHLALVLLAVALEEVKHQRLNVLAALRRGGR